MRLFKRGQVWYAQFYDVDGVRQTRTTRCHDRAAAEQVARRLERHGANPDHAAASAATLNDALDAMIEDSEARARAGELSMDTVEFYRARAGHLVRAQSELDARMAEPVLPPLLHRLEARHVDAYIAMRRAESVSSSTIARELVVLRVSLRKAKRHGRWGGDLDRVMPERFSPEYKPRKRWLPPAELELLLATLGAPVAESRVKTNAKRGDRAACVAFMVGVGARLKEAMSARPEDIDLDGGRVRLRGTKTDASARVVPLVAPWQRRLIEQASRGGVGVGGRLFRPWGKVQNDLRKACERTGIERCSPNDLRRTYSQWMRQAGVPVELIAASMGHVDSRMVERVYGALGEAQLEARMRSALGVSDAVAPVFQNPRSDAHNLDCDVPVGRPVGLDFCRDFGSSCWTRTSDPVINRPAASARVASRFLGWCSTGETDPMPGLARAVRLVGADFDTADAMLARIAGGAA